MQSSYDGSTHRQNKESKEFFLSYDPLNPEHEAIGRVHWVKLTMCKYFTLHSGAKTLELYKIILASFVTIYDILQG
jgi:hypothetical protein